MAKKLVMVECVSTFHLRYCIEVEDDIDHALDEIVMRPEGMEEVYQKHLDVQSVCHREVSQEEYLKIFDKDHPGYDWSDERKLNRIYKINYDT
jgi:hypothetical protein